MVTGSGLFITDDITDATPWTQLGATSDPSGGFCSVQVAVDGGTPTFYGFTRCDSGPNSIAENNNPGQLWKFEGEGPSGSWERVDDNGLDGGFHQVAVDPNDPDRLYAADAVGTGFEMVFSTDGGDSWDPDPNLDALMVGDPLQTGDPAFVDRSQVGPTGFTAFAGYRQPTLLAYDPEDPDIIVAGGRDSGVFISSNSGADWALLTDPYTPASSGIPHLPRPRFAYFDHVAGDAALYVGTEGRGIWRADLAEADLSVTKSDSPDPVTAGESLTYAITVTNDGPDPAGNLLLTDPLPAGTTFDSLVAPAGWTCETPDAGDPGTIRCGLSSLAVGVPQAFTVTVDVAASVPDGTVLSNTATIVSNAIDEDQSDNSATETTDVVAEADLVVTKTDDPDPVLAGSELTYTIEVTNDGPSDAQNVEIEDVLPPQTEFKSATPSAGGACVTPPVDTNGTVTCTWAGGTAPGDTRSVDIVVRVISTGPVFDTATTSSDTTDPDPTDNEATAETTVICSITGTPLDDMLVGTQGDDVICGLEGDDKIVGLGGHDFIVGGEGDDDINANDGDDEVRAEGGDDKVYGNDGADLLFGNDGNDALHGGAGLDDIRGGAGDDKCKEGPDGAVLTGCE
jgi:uncharacterized repeat protein (TIGR01451 family)